MEELFNIDLKKTSLFSKKDETNREKNLKLFLESGFPNKKDESREPTYKILRAGDNMTSVSGIQSSLMWLVSA